jgi:hypothetical protein
LSMTSTANRTRFSTLLLCFALPPHLWRVSMKQSSSRQLQPLWIRLQYILYESDYEYIYNTVAPSDTNCPNRPLRIRLRYYQCSRLFARRMTTYPNRTWVRRRNELAI